MTNMRFEELAQKLRAEAWGLVLAAQAPGREEQEAMWFLGVSERVDAIADALMAEARGGEGGAHYSRLAAKSLKRRDFALAATGGRDGQDKTMRRFQRKEKDDERHDRQGYEQCLGIRPSLIAE